MKLSKEHIEMKELNIIAIVSASQASRNRTGMDQIKFMQKILEFFNYNISLAKRDPKSKKRLDLLMGIFPTIKELNKSFKECPPVDNVIYLISPTFAPLSVNQKKQLLMFTIFWL